MKARGFDDYWTTTSSRFAAPSRTPWVVALATALLASCQQPNPSDLDGGEDYDVRGERDDTGTGPDGATEDAALACSRFGGSCDGRSCCADLDCYPDFSGRRICSCGVAGTPVDGSSGFGCSVCCAHRCDASGRACATGSAGDNCGTDRDCDTALCIDGVCVRPGPLGCPPGRGDCNGTDDDGCEVDFTVPTTCGACTNVCPSPSDPTRVATCDEGVCGTDCAADLADCNGLPDDGCETSVDTTTNCGGCGVACGPAQQCEAGACCVGDGGGCGFGLEVPCCSALRCLTNYCGMAACIGAGAACRTADSCCSGICNEGRCCGALGDTCTSPTDCCLTDQTCHVGRCCRVFGARCTAASDCCSGRCSGGTCTS